MQESFDDLIKELSASMSALGLMVATAESCTGGMIASRLTDLPGSSEIFERGFVTYSNNAKIELLDVPEETLSEHGAVSPHTAMAMVRGALAHSRAEIAISVTGIAGPGGGTEDKPVGLVYIGCGMKGGVMESFEHRFKGDRDEIREQTVIAALNHVMELVKTLA
jgi:PncC family amidohydrolase